MFSRLPLSLLFGASLLWAGSLCADEPPTTMENSVGMRFVSIPPGAYRVGSPEAEPGRSNNETPRQVRIERRFYMGVVEVTQDQFRAVMDSNPSAFRGEASGDQPVESVTWNEAVEFCRRLSDRPSEKTQGRRYRLPSEDEWEIAARAGSDSAWGYGNDVRRLSEVAVFGAPLSSGPRRVGQLRPNAWGLFDMHGNVWEWCADKFRVGESNQAEENEFAELRAIRGGGFASPAYNTRSAAREHDPRQVRDSDLGFRVLLEWDPPAAPTPK